MSEGRLFVCGTPIGNLADVSERLVATLRQVDVVYAEDTRRTSKLLAHLSCKAPLRSLFVGNEQARTEELLNHLRAGESVALVSDAGMPVVSDPGAEAVARARSEGLSVSVIPGPSAVSAALALSGFSGDRFVFEGFLPRKGSERRRRIDSLAGEDRSVVLFASPHRLARDLADLERALGGDRRVVIAREMTKVHEEVWSGSLAEAAATWTEARGEITLVIEPGQIEAVSADQAIDAARQLVEEGLSVSEAARKAAADTGAPRRQVYQALLEDQADS